MWGMRGWIMIITGGGGVLGDVADDRGGGRTGRKKVI